jgi:tetratricopeptide (TPR) repeat protein
MFTLTQEICIKSLIFLLITGLLFSPMPGFVSMAIAQGKCTEVLNDAEKMYNTGRFDEAIESITSCLNKSGITEDEKMRAYRLLGLAYIAKDYLEDAKTAVQKLLDMVPNYQSDPVQDPPPFTKMVEEVKEQKQTKVTEPVPRVTQVTEPEEQKGGSKKWYYIGGGVLAAGVLVGILASGSGDGNGNGPPPAQPLPGPPSIP